MISRRTFLKTSGLALGATALPVFGQSAKARKTVLLQSAWATKNIGDIGHTPGTLRFLEQYLPEAKVILWAAKTNDEVDAMHTSLFRELLTYMMEDPHNISQCIHLLFCTKSLERVGDHATNIAEAAYYLETGRQLGQDETQRQQL